MGTNKSKLRRERKKQAQSQPQVSPPEQKRFANGWATRLAFMIPPVLYACYLVWDLGWQ
jgi:hypothetical protein